MPDLLEDKCLLTIHWLQTSIGLKEAETFQNHIDKCGVGAFLPYILWSYFDLETTSQLAQMPFWSAKNNYNSNNMPSFGLNLKPKNYECIPLQKTVLNGFSSSSSICSNACQIREVIWVLKNLFPALVRFVNFKNATWNISLVCILSISFGWTCLWQVLTPT